MEWLFWPSLKQFGLLHFIGLSLVIAGQGIRSAAEFTAGSNFTHLGAVDKRSEHRLVTKGIYAKLRHPSYFGYFIWAIGTQMLLGNPFCTVAYAAVTWKFFSERIEFEERFLVEFFGAEYTKYRAVTPVGIPFIQ